MPEPSPRPAPLAPHRSGRPTGVRRLVTTVALAAVLTAGCGGPEPVDRDGSLLVSDDGSEVLIRLTPPR